MIHKPHLKDRDFYVSLNVKLSPIFLRKLAYQRAGMLTLGLSSLLFDILNDACTLLSQILTGCSLLSQKYCKHAG